MSIERVATIFSPRTGDRFKILFGPGIDDVFYNRRFIELKFEEALFEELRRQGYDRIVFFSPHRSIFFFDSQSEELTRPKQYLQGQTTSSVMVSSIAKGPLDSMKVYQPNILTEGPTRYGIGDVFAVRMLDKIMREENSYRSAVVILQTETALRYFDDQRTMAGLVGEWTRLPSSNRNICLFVFSSDTYEELGEVANSITVPEIRIPILNQTEALKEQSNLIRISTPDVREIRNMVMKYQQSHPIRLDGSVADLLFRRMAAEGKKNRYWITRLQEIESFDLESTRLHQWFVANIDAEHNVWERMDKLVGLDPVKERIRELIDWVKVVQQRKRENPDDPDIPSLHMIFSGNPGTGKTTVARMFGEILYEIGLLKKGHMVEARVSDLVAGHVGGTAMKTNTMIDRALDGVLFIDEAYALTQENRGGFGSEAVDTILARMENDRNRLVVIAAGYPGKIDQFRRSNPGLERRFPVENIIYFPDFSPQELKNIFYNMLAERELKIDPNELLVFNQLILELWNRRDENFGNAGEIRNIVEGLDRRRASRIIENGLSDTDVVRIDDLPMSYIHLLPTSLTEQSDVLKELDGLVGLVEVKNYLLNLINRLEYENIRTKTQSILTRRPKLNHLVFKGNPGTGKTTVARLVGKIYHSLGLLRKGHCVEVTRVDLVAGYVGQSAIKTMEKIHEALDGVLFIDEAYSLVNESGQNYGQEVIDTLVKAMENYQSRFIVIIAGYPNEIDSLLMTNPGLVSRFASHLTFEDYSSDELGKILSNSLEDNGYIYTEDVIKKAELFLEAEKQLQQKYFGNARSALTLFETIISRMAQRIVPLIKSSTNAPNDTFLNTVLVEDVPEPQTFILPQDQLNLLTARKNKARF